MRELIALFMLAASFAAASAQTQMNATFASAGGLPAACGPEKQSPGGMSDGTRKAAVEPEQGKARIYVLRDDGVLETGPKVRIGLDGKWIGENRGNSWFSVLVGPGEHHVCAIPDSKMKLGNLVELAHFRAEAGKDYYLRSRFTITPYQEYLVIDFIDSDQGKYLAAKLPQAVSQPGR
ncbi:MAG: DUF2846 domain-containing protein [Terracidiphilus sp.]|jgi:hypothetical protein